MNPGWISMSFSPKTEFNDIHESFADRVRVCQVKTYHTELTSICPCMALIDIHDYMKNIGPRAWTLLTQFIMTRVATNKGLDECLGLDSIIACLLLLNF